MNRLGIIKLESAVFDSGYRGEPTQVIFTPISAKVHRSEAFVQLVFFRNEKPATLAILRVLPEREGQVGESLRPGKDDVTIVAAAGGEGADVAPRADGLAGGLTEPHEELVKDRASTSWDTVLISSSSVSSGVMVFTSPSLFAILWTWVSTGIAGLLKA